MSYEIVDAKQLLTYNRLDLGFKLFFLDVWEYYPSLAKEIYKEDIRAQTIDSFIEPDTPEKNSFEAYLDDFINTYESIASEGFDHHTSLIPLASDGTIRNGAHRVASAIALGEKVAVKKQQLPSISPDFTVYHERNVDERITEIAVNKFIEYANDVYIAFLWPSGKAHLEKTQSLIDNVVYRKKISLTYKGAFNLLFELYKHMDWVGSEGDGWFGLKQKLTECFPSLNGLVVLAFQGSSLEEVREIKEKIRDINGIGFSSVHITDTKEEAIEISELIFNDNGLHFLNFGDPRVYCSSVYLENLANRVEQSSIDSEKFVLSGSFLLELYGLRKSRDVDCLCALSEKNGLLKLGIDIHDSQLEYYQADKNRIIYDPRYYFIYRGIKIVSFDQLYKMKCVRGEQKDLIDSRRMEALVENKNMKRIFAHFHQKILYAKVKSKIWLMSSLIFLLKRTGLYLYARSIYQSIKK